MDSSLAAPAVWASSPFRIPLQSELSPEEAVLWLRGDKRPFALIGEWLGGGAVLGSEPRSVAPQDCDPFSLLGSRAYRTGGSEATIGGGWVGWLGYQLGARVERLPPPPPPRSAAPAFSLAFYDHVVLFDGERWWFEGLGTPEREATLRRRLEVWEARLGAAPAPLGAPTRLRFSVAANGSAGHVAAVDDCRERIVSGELLQANICLRLESRFGGDPIDLFALALTRVRPRFGALVDGLVSLSPERFLRREGRRVWSEPIKGTGTRRQQQDSGSDELLRSAKDAAEHVMIVDLMRNDLGRVCAYGTVSADTRRIEPHGALWHLVSTVSGRLRDDVDDGALLRATFPPGSVTGAPKVQAMKVIASLESTRREAYTGAIGIVSPVAGLDLSVAIRTFELSGGDIWLGAGGGIVADSEAESELAEALAKASGPIGAIGGWIDDGTRPGWRRATPVASRALLFGRRPDPAHGVFETVLIEDGVAVLLEAHLERLAASVRALYGTELVPDTRSRLAAAATATLARSALRILADPDGSIALTLTPATEVDKRPAYLSPFAIPGGLGVHKWRDRDLLRALAAHTPGTVPLLVDTDGQVLEAAHANVWLVEDQAFITPRTDGRILPGATRAALLASAPQARAEAFDLARLAGADAIFLTSSIRGSHPAALSDAGDRGLVSLTR